MGKILAVLWGFMVGVGVFAVIAVLSCFLGGSMERTYPGLMFLIWAIGFFGGLYVAVLAGMSVSNYMAKPSDE